MVSSRLRWGIAVVWGMAGCVAVVTVGTGVWWRHYVRSPLSVSLDSAGPTTSSDSLATGLELYRPGIENPQFADPRDQRVTEQLPVIGVVVAGQSYAYSIEALSMPSNLESVTSMYDLARRHVVNQLVEGKAISITYCDLSSCTRVLTKEAQSRPLELGIGGVFGRSLVLCYGGQQFTQDSPEIPLDDHPFEITTWSKWVTQHPDSKIYLGDT